MVVIIYYTDVLKEYLLPSLVDADYEIRLEKELYGFHKDLYLKMESTKDGWSFLPGLDYDIYKDGKCCGSILVHDQDLLEFYTQEGRRIQAMISDTGNRFPVMKKFDISACSEILFGSNPANHIVYQYMGLVSKYHGMLYRGSDGWYLEDSSRNGIFCGNRRVYGKRRLVFGEVIHVFGLHLVWLGNILAVDCAYGEMELHQEKSRPMEPVQDHSRRNKETSETDYYHRSPRSFPPLAEEMIKIEGPPSKPVLKQKPLLLTVGPAFTMAIPMLIGCLVVFLATRLSGRAASAFMFTGVITAVGAGALGVFWGLMNVRYARRQQVDAEDQRFNAYGNYLIQEASYLKERYQQNQRALEYLYPPASVCVSYDRYTPALWNRNETHRDLLFERLGTGDIPFQVEISIPEKRFVLEEDSLMEKPEKIKEEYRMLRQVPVGINLMQNRLVGLVGGKRKHGSIELMQLLSAQIAANNCYTDVKLVYIYDRKHTPDAGAWESMKWFPHVWSQGGHTRYLAADRNQAGDIFFELVNIFRRRERKEGKNQLLPLPWYVVFIEDMDLLEGELIRKYLLEPKPEYGVTAFLMSEQKEQLPNECKTFVQKSGRRGRIIYEGEYEKNQNVWFDTVSAGELEQFGRTLAPVQVNEQEINTELPEQLGFLQMYQARTPEDLRVLERWRKNRTYHSMRVPIGQKAGGALCCLDIHEKYHGPHGLIAGTTGSGKSETLQTWLLSLAVNFSPEDVNFFIIDFKGGGMANLFENLPHLAGKISNLSGNQIRRAMISIKSENRRRQKIFGEYGVNHINQYTKLYKNQEAPEPIPHLLIIIDEFAELKKEEPDFMRELISVAQVGRSLGVHLILSTQKPGGTVDDNIRSNSKFRLCLRVENRQDSMDMIEKPDAAFLTQAGRCYLRVGNDEVYELFQSAYSGGIYSPENEAGQEEAAILLNRSGKAAVVGNRRKHRKAEETKEITQLEAVVNMLAQTAREYGYSAGRRLWMPLLPEQLYLEELDHESGKDPAGSLRTPFGLLDDPFTQSQRTVWVDFAEKGSYVVCGSVVSGKSTLLQTIVCGLVKRYTPEQLNLYLIDFSSRMLSAFASAPHTGGMIYENEEEKVGRLFRFMDKILQERKKLLEGGTYTQYVRAYGQKFPAVLLVLDNVAGFREKTKNQYDDDLLKLAREGAGYGIYLLLSAGGFGMTELPNRIAGNIRNVISLEMTDRYKYMDVLHVTRLPLLPEAGKKGRGLVEEQGQILEFQAAMAVRAWDDYGRISILTKWCEEQSEEWQGRRAEKIPEIPEEPTLDDLEKLRQYQICIQEKIALVAGYRKEDASVYQIPLRRLYCYLLLGKPRSGRKNMLRLFMNEAAQMEGQCTVVEMGTAALKQDAERLKMDYLTDAVELYQSFQKLLPVFRDRNLKKRELLEKGMTEDEVFAEMQKETPVFYFIADLAAFFQTVYRPDKTGQAMAPFVENMMEKGSLHNIYFIGCLNTDDAAAGAGWKAFQNFIGYKTGICLSAPGSQRIYHFANIPYTRMNRPPAKGNGYAVMEDDTEATAVVLPLAGRRRV